MGKEGECTAYLARETDNAKTRFLNCWRKDLMSARARFAYTDYAATPLETARYENRFCTSPQQSWTDAIFFSQPRHLRPARC